MQPIPWYRAWAGILRYPSVYNFEVLILNPNARRRTAFNWLAMIGIFFHMVNSLVAAIVMQQLTGGPQENVMAVSGIFFLLGLPLAAGASILGLAIAVAFQNALAKLLGGSGNYDQLIYAETVFFAPLLLISSVLRQFPVVYLLNIPLAIYGCILSVMAIKAVHQLGWGRAIIASLAELIFGLLLAVVILTLFAGRGLLIL